MGDGKVARLRKSVPKRAAKKTTRDPHLVTDLQGILQAIMDNTHAQLAYLDPQFNFVLVNAAYARGSGHTKEELIGRNHFELFPNAENRSIFERVRDRGEGLEFFDKPFVYADQPERGVTHWNWTCVPVKDAGGHVRGLVLSLMDVTETLRAQQAERDHARKITAILESITDSYIALDQEWRFTDFNLAAERSILRKPRQELLGKVIWDEFPIVAGSEFQRQFRIALAEQRPVHFEAEAGPSGLWYEALASPTREGLSVYLRDITERKREAELNARFAAIVESSEDAIVGLTNEGMISSWNPAAERLFGYSAAEISGKPVSILYAPDHPDEFPQIMQQLKLGERIEHYETRRVRKDGSQIEVALSMSPIKDPQGRVIGAAKIARNITGQKRAREAERFLAEASAVLASSLDYRATLQGVARLALPSLADYCVVDIVEEDESLRRVAFAASSPARERLLGEFMAHFPPGADAMGAGQVLKSGLPRVVREMPDSMASAVAGDPELTHILRELDPKSYMIVPMIARGRTLGTIWLGMAASSHSYDEADLEVAEDLARRAAYAVDNARLYFDTQAAVSARDRFLSLASHEVRTPLTVIQGYTQLLRQQAEQFEASSDSTAQLDYAKLLRGLRNIEYSAARLEALMSDLLDITRLPNGVLSISPERMSLSESLTRVIESVRGQKQHQKRSSQIALTVEMPNGEVWGEWDRVRLEQVVTNLVDNAIKYSPRGGAIRIRLAVEVEAGREWAHLTVSDQGIGIPPTELGRIFHPFMRATNAVEREYPGLGIGLAVTGEIVNRHGGRIWVESKGIDQGSTFHVMLPMPSN
jgi:PAS domain S-box-containing protein